EVDRIGPGPLARDHCPPVGIGALRRDAELEGEVAAARRVDVERPGSQGVAVVEPGGQPMAVADLAAPAAADHAEPQSPAHRCHPTCLAKSCMMSARRNMPPSPLWAGGTGRGGIPAVDSG